MSHTHRHTFTFAIANATETQFFLNTLLHLSRFVALIVAGTHVYIYAFTVIYVTHGHRQ